MKLIIVFILCLILISCDGGLNPENSIIKSGKAILKGTIIYKGGIESWVNADSVYGIRVVAFKKFPPDDVIQEILIGNAYFTLESLPLFVDSSSFEIEISDAPSDLQYIAVAQQFADSITAQRVVGIYSQSGDNTKPSVLRVEPQKSYFIRIDVDFNNLPPQPF